MKYIKRFENWTSVDYKFRSPIESLAGYNDPVQMQYKKATRKEIYLFCKENDITNYIIDAYNHNLVNVNQDVNLKKNYTEIPIHFGEIDGNFNCSMAGLTTLHGAPHTVNGDFICSYNELKSLKFGPSYIKGDLLCDHNKLEKLFDHQYTHYTKERMLKPFHRFEIVVEGDIDCSNNNLTELTKLPDTVKSLNCSMNKLTSLSFMPRKINGDFDCSNNDLTNIDILLDVTVTGDFDCSYNPIEDFNIKYGELNVNGDFKFYIRNKIKRIFNKNKINKKFNIKGDIIIENKSLKSFE